MAIVHGLLEKALCPQTQIFDENLVQREYSWILRMAKSLDFLFDIEQA
ncbi:hypothetical protein [Nostoc sp. DedQUE09]|nr:hypothetical protein [Nostoc sp. DedQUE09]MDZ7952494.1 hypothetical protein [Nostoc sp. DedQUE09]